MTNDKTTPRPWVVRHGLEIERPADGGRAPDPIANTSTRRKTLSEAHANAELIVRAVNNHDALIDSLEQVCDLLDGVENFTDEMKDALTDAYHVLKLAKGE